MSTPTLETAPVGTIIGPLEVHLDRADLVQYAGASGDFNPIHWNARVATSVGLDDVIAHGMLTMALGGRLITDWVGDPTKIIDYQVRFTRPIVVPDPDGADVTLVGKVRKIDEAAGTVEVDLTVTVADMKVLGKARATVTLRGSQ